MNDERFQHLFAAARAYYHVKDDIFNLAKDQARRQYRQTMDLLELESTPEQWREVIEAVEAEWPQADETMLGRSQRQDDEERAAARPAGIGYTGRPCVVCNRIRVFLRADGREQCEKCESFQGPQVSDSA